MIRTLHRLVWQSLPREFRRNALFRATELLAPRATRDVAAAEPIIVAGYLSTASGLGESARLALESLSGAGLDVRGFDLASSMMQLSDLEGYSFRKAEPSPGPGTILFFINAPLIPLALMRMPRSMLRDKRIVGYWAWELEQVPPEWRRGYRYVHEIWGPSSFCANAFEEVANGRPSRVLMLPVAGRREVTLPDWNAASHRPFTVLVAFNMASSFARKNPLASIVAFKAAFADAPSARLILRATNADVYPEGLEAMKRAIGDSPNISLQTNLLSTADLDRLYANVDVYMALHRSEGFGLGIAEAMLRGLPTVATGWSGCTDFHDPEVGFPIEYDLVPARDAQGEYDHPELVWAEARTEHAAAALKRLAGDPALRRRIGERAREAALRRLGREAFADRARELLRLPAGKA